MAVAFLSAQRSKDPNKQASWVAPEAAQQWKPAQNPAAFERCLSAEVQQRILS